mmetsp:Transcript_13600/g.34937  ORF Transcript_13600/g.34937 Transcript_13600/m.34937 type:complete len:273 (-) Transcript_13600:331-1149(-)
MPESAGASPRVDFDDRVRAFFAKYSWDTYQSKHLKYLEIPSYDLETGLATDEVCHITDQDVTDEDCDSLAKALIAMKPENLKQLYLSNNMIGDPGCIALAEATAVVPNLELLFLSSNRIGDAGLTALAEKASKAPVWQLVLTDNESIGDEGAIALAHAVSKAPSEAFIKLKWLFLDSTSIGDKGVEALASAMVAGMPNIERLALHNCKLTNRGLASLATAIDRGALAKCQYLYVQKNDFDSDGKQILKAAAKLRGIKVHFGWPPPLPGVDYD